MPFVVSKKIAHSVFDDPARLEKSETISAEIVRANAALKENRRTGDHIVRRLNRLTKIISEREMAE